MSVITDWRIHEEDLPDVPPGEMFEQVIRPQQYVVLCRILVRDLHLGLQLERLQVGNVEIPFHLEGGYNGRRAYLPRPRDLGKALAAIGAALTTTHMIKIVPGQDVRVTLRNRGDHPVKPRAALLVRQEVT